MKIFVYPSEEDWREPILVFAESRTEADLMYVKWFDALIPPQSYGVFSLDTIIAEKYLEVKSYEVKQGVIDTEPEDTSPQPCSKCGQVHWWSQQEVGHQ